MGNIATILYHLLNISFLHPHHLHLEFLLLEYNGSFIYKKGGATHSQIIGREYYIDRLKTLFKGAPEWSIEEKNFPKERHGKEDVFDKIEYYRTDNPVFQIKTHKGMRYYTKSDRTPIHEIPYWGNGKVVRMAYL